MVEPQPQNFYSADVNMWIDCGVHGCVALTHTASTFVIAADAHELPACDAELILTIDGRRYVRPIRLVNGMTRMSRKAMILSRDAIAPF